MKNQHEVEKLAYAMTRQRYLLNRDIVHDLFTELSPSDYIALHSIAEAAGQGGSAEHGTGKNLSEGSGRASGNADAQGVQNGPQTP